MYTYKGKPIELLAITYVWNGKQYCTILMENRLGRKQRQSVLLRHLIPVVSDATSGGYQPTDGGLDISNPPHGGSGVPPHR